MLSNHSLLSIVSYMVSSCLLESRLIVFSSSCTLVFVVNKTDLELLQFDYLSRVRIETDVHLLSICDFCNSNSMYALPDLIWSASTCDRTEQC